MTSLISFHVIRTVFNADFEPWRVFYKHKAVKTLEEERMQDHNYLREQARKCCTLAKTAIEPELIEQLRVWSVELADEADMVERRSAEREETIILT